MKKLGFIILLFTFSCKDFIKETPNEEVVYEHELKKVDYSQVEEYPTFESCNGKSEAERRSCFFETLSEEIRIKLLDDSLQKYIYNENSLTLKVTVEKDARLIFLPILEDSLSPHKLKIDSIIENRLTNFSAILPAKNKGVAVKTEFQMNVKLK